MIARRGEILAFVEVKTRGTGARYPAQDAVTPAKQGRLVRAALCYLQEHPGGLQPRFDVCEVYVSPERRVWVRYLENAFDGNGLPDPGI